MLFISLLGIYLATGILFALYFVLTGFQAVLPDAAGTKFHVRVIWMPAAMALWPLLVGRLIAGTSDS